MQFLPIFMDLKDQNVLVVGGGEVASRKVDLLLSALARVCVVSPRFNDTLERYVEDKKITVIRDHYRDSYLTDCMMVWVTTDDGQLNQLVWQDCQQRSLLVNVADQPALCSFITPSIIDRSPIQIAISSGGTSPVLIRYLREKLESLLPMSLGTLAAFAGEKRAQVKQQYATVTERRRFWEGFFSSSVTEFADDKARLEQAFTAQLSATPGSEPAGDIYLVNLPADPELLTLKALRFMQQSDVILFAESTDEAFIELCRRDAERLPAPVTEQANRALQRRAAGERVCILAGSDTSLTLLQSQLSDAMII